MKHKHADLLIAAANDESITFTFDDGKSIFGIFYVLNQPDFDWQIFKAPEKWQKEKEAFARGEIIQFRDSQTSRWLELELNEPLCWGCNYYRIKPSTETRWLWANKAGIVTDYLLTSPVGEFTVKLEWSATEFELESE